MHRDQYVSAIAMRPSCLCALVVAAIAAASPLCHRSRILAAAIAAITALVIAEIAAVVVADVVTTLTGIVSAIGAAEFAAIAVVVVAMNLAAVGDLSGDDAITTGDVAVAVAAAVAAAVIAAVSAIVAAVVVGNAIVIVAVIVAAGADAVGAVAASVAAAVGAAVGADAVVASVAATVGAAAIAVWKCIPRTRGDAALAALDVLTFAREIGAAARRGLGACLVMRGDPLGWERALYPLRGRPILHAGRPVRAFRIAAPGRGDPRARPAAAWLYASCPEPGKEDWQRCAGLYKGPAPYNPPTHVLDLYGDGEIALGVGVVVRFRNRGDSPMQRILAIRRGGQETAAVAVQNVPLGGFSPEALIRAALESPGASAQRPYAGRP